MWLWNYHRSVSTPISCKIVSYDFATFVLHGIIRNVDSRKSITYTKKYWKYQESIYHQKSSLKQTLITYLFEWSVLLSRSIT
jgi:hypothetical protein